MKRIFVLALLIMLVSCERDDICAEGTQTTARLVISFNNVDSPDDTKNVPALTVTPLNTDGSDLQSIVVESTTNTISLPLRIQDDQVTDPITTTYRLTKDSDDEDSANSDVINITYTTEFVYISRACGYSSIFNLDNVPATAFNVEADMDNWILSFEINNSRIENETEAHITLLH